MHGRVAGTRPTAWEDFRSVKTLRVNIDHCCDSSSPSVNRVPASNLVSVHSEAGVLAGYGLQETNGLAIA